MLTRDEKLKRVFRIREYLRQKQSVNARYRTACCLSEDLYQHQMKRLYKIEDNLVTNNGKHKVTRKPTKSTLIRC